MRNATKIIIAATILATVTAATILAAAAGGSGRIYAISGESGGYLLWNASEAYFFMKVDDLGYSWSSFQYPWVLFKRYIIGGFAVVEVPSDRRAYLAVMRATASGVERHVLKLDRVDRGPGSDPGRFTPLEGRIFAFCPTVIGHFMQNGQKVGKDMDDGLCWWAGDHFEKATQEEQQRLNGIKRLTKSDFENDESGWSRRSFGAGPVDRKFTIDVTDNFQISVNNVAVQGTENGTVLIDLLRPGKAPERVGDFHMYQGRVSEAEYQRVFDGSK